MDFSSLLIVFLSVNGEPVITMATSSVKTSVSSVVSQVKMSPSLHTSSVAAVKLPEGSTVQDSSKPVMRVSPLIDSVNGHQLHGGVIFTTGNTFKLHLWWNSKLYEYISPVHLWVYLYVYPPFLAHLSRKLLRRL